MEQEKDTLENRSDDHVNLFSSSQVKSFFIFKTEKRSDPTKSHCKRSRSALGLKSRLNALNPMMKRKVKKKRKKFIGFNPSEVLEAIRDRLPDLSTRIDSFVSLNNQSLDLSSLFEIIKTNNFLLVGNSSEEALRINYEIFKIILEKFTSGRSKI